MEKETMLVVEDEEIMREVLVDYFSGEGHTVDVPHQQRARPSGPSTNPSGKLGMGAEDTLVLHRDRLLRAGVDRILERLAKLLRRVRVQNHELTVR